MNLFGRFGRWLNRSEREPTDTVERDRALPPRPEILRVPDIDEMIGFRAHPRPLEDVEEDEDPDDGRYRVRPEHHASGPRWDPFAEDQSVEARVKAARQARTRPDEPIVYDRFDLRPETAPRLTHYQLLGVSHDAPIQQIERAYRRYAASIHPDRFFDDPKARAQAEQQLRELNAIMQVLRDPGRRAKYDSTL